MVANTQETMTKMFDSMNETFKNTMGAFGRIQESCFKPFAESFKAPTDFDARNFGFEGLAKSWVPFVERSIQNFTESCNATFEAGLQAAKTATPTNGNTDFAKDAQKAFDATVKAFGTNVETLSKACVRNTENCTKLMTSVFSHGDCSKDCGTTSREDSRSDAKGATKGQSK